jgi:hypothetical protein
LLFLRSLADSADCSSEGIWPVRLSSRSAKYSALNRGLGSAGAVGGGKEQQDKRQSQYFTSCQDRLPNQSLLVLPNNWA